MINQVTLVGRLTKDPELRYTPDGKAVSNITLAVNRNFRNTVGNYEADFVQCIIWKKSAENTAQYCKKRSHNRHHWQNTNKEIRKSGG